VSVGESPEPLRPICPPGLRSFERSRDERSARRAAFASIESFDGGVEEFVEFIPSRRRSSAFSASNTSTRVTNPTTSAASSSYEGWDDSGADTTQMIGDQRPNHEPDTPPPTKINSQATAQLNGTREWTPPQGSAVSPVLANLFMHYAFDSWLEREFPAVEFERFADDAVVHCATERQAHHVWAALAERLESVGLRLHPDKTKVVYCKDRKRRRTYERTSFTFLGYTFRARKAPTSDGRSMFTAFLPAISKDALKDKGSVVRRWRIPLRTTSDLAELAEWMNPVIRGWMNYYGKFYRTEMDGLLRRINTYLVRWARRKFKRLRAFKRAKRWWNSLQKRQPSMFVHWAWMPQF
jgi:hypothetical protein